MRPVNRHGDLAGDASLSIFCSGQRASWIAGLRSSGWKTAQPCCAAARVGPIKGLQQSARSMRNLFLVIGNYGLATFATAVVSASHLLLQLSVLHSLGASEFGLVAFMLTVMQFSSGLCNAAVAAPYTVLASRNQKHSSRSENLFSINAMLALANGVLAVFISHWLSEGAGSAMFLFGLANFAYTVRWFGRTHAYTHGSTMSAAVSDIVYSAVILIGLLISRFTGMSLVMASALLAAASVSGSFAFGYKFIRQHMRLNQRAALADYLPIWKDQAKWAVAGLVTTEATANAHSYIVTWTAGPAAFAPIAVAMLFLRPIGVCMVALTQLERPAMARAIADGNSSVILQSVLRFVGALVGIWIATMIAIFVVFKFFPEVAIKPGIDERLVVIAVAAWAAICLIQCVQTPLNVLMQAQGRFKELADTSIKACFVTILGVFTMLYAAGPVYSTLGVLAGQLLMTYAIFTYVRTPRVIDSYR
jgi:O-antigen/teichoic acid export membrane protein